MRALSFYVLNHSENQAPRSTGLIVPNLFTALSS